MRILHFASSDGIFGSAKCLTELLKYEISVGDIPIVITPKVNQINKFCDEQKIVNYVVNYQQFMIPKHDSFPVFLYKYFFRLVEYYLKILGAVKQVEKIIDFSHVDIVHTNVSVISIGAIVAKRNNKPHIWHIREYGKEDFHFVSVITDTIAFMNKNTSKFIAISEAVRENWIKRGIDVKKIVTRYDGVEDVQDDEVQKAEMRDTATVKIVMAGAISETKGQAKLIEAIKHLPPTYKDRIIIDIYGSGQEKYVAHLKQLIKRESLSNIHFKGYSNDIRKILSNYDIGVICSKSEGFGRVTVEYMLSKLLVVASNSGANREILNNGKCGILFDIESEDDLSTALIEAIEDCKNRSKVEQAYLFAKQNFIFKDNAKRIREVFLNEVSIWNKRIE